MKDNHTKPKKLTLKAKIIYTYLELVAKKDPTKWTSKEELLEMFGKLFNEGDSQAHDICSSLNSIRLELNRARARGELKYLVLLHNNKFKLATSREEVEKYCKRDKENGIKLLVRYYQNIGVLKTDGQGRLIDCNGNIIDENSLEQRFNEPFVF